MKVTALVRMGAAAGLLAVGLAACSSSSATPAANAKPKGHRGSGVMGVVTAASVTALSLQERSGAIRSFSLTSATRVLHGGAAVGPSALGVGEQVRVSLAPGSTSRAARVVILRPSVSGTVVSISATSLTIRTSSGALVTVATSSATVYRSGAATTSRSAVTQGARVRVQENGSSPESATRVSLPAG
ncbi:MAG: DUF5666 domain-containing protein [Mycobacteriales bacterium]